MTEVAEGDAKVENEKTVIDIEINLKDLETQMKPQKKIDQKVEQLVLDPELDPDLFGGINDQSKS